jgi:hypothetical protein
MLVGLLECAVVAAWADVSRNKQNTAPGGGPTYLVAFRLADLHGFSGFSGSGWSAKGAGPRRQVKNKLYKPPSFPRKVPDDLVMSART